MDPVSNPAILESSLSKSKNENSDFCLAINFFVIFVIVIQRNWSFVSSEGGKVI
jgi:hypothetical protein